MKHNNVINVIMWVLVLLAVTTAGGAIAYFTGGFTEDFKTFYLNVDGKDVLSSASDYKVSTDAPMTVKIKYTIPSDEEKGYSVKIVPNVMEGKDFDFTVDGETYSFQAETDFTAGFDIAKDESSFSVNPKGDLNDVLASVYPGSEVEKITHGGYENMFLLIVESYDGDSAVTVAFSLVSKVTGIELVPNHIYF